jgi:hypothetical protein
MIVLNEYRKLLRIRVDYQGNDQYFFRVVNTDNLAYKDHTIRATPEKMLRYLQRIQAKDTKTTPASMRNVTYKVMLDGIMNNTDNEIWVWAHMWKPSTRKFFFM